MLSCLYQGYVQHRRLTPAKHVFRYGLYMAYLDLDELPSLLQGGAGLHQARFSPASFCRTDHLGDPKQPLSDAVRDLVQDQTGWRPAGPIRLLTLLRNWGYYFNPLSLYYCFDRTGQVVDAVVAEVTQHSLARAALVRALAGQSRRRVNATAIPPSQGFSRVAIYGHGHAVRVALDATRGATDRGNRQFPRR